MYKPINTACNNCIAFLHCIILYIDCIYGVVFLKRIATEVFSCTVNVIIVFDRPHRGHLLEGNMDGRLQHPQPVDNTGRLPDRRDQGFDRPDGVAFECGPGEEPPFKKSRSSPPRPLFSEKEISEIREKRHDSPDHPFEQTGYHEPWRHENIRQPPPEFFDNQGPHLGLRPPHFPLPRDAPFAPRGMPREFLRPPQHFPGELEIPMELALDNESEILRSVSFCAYILYNRWWSNRVRK